MHLGQKRESPALRAGLSPEIQVCRKEIQFGILNQGPIHVRDTADGSVPSIRISRTNDFPTIPDSGY